MKTGIDFVALATEIKRRSEAKKDLIVPTNKIEMIKAEKGNGIQMVAGTNVFDVNNHAHDQIGTHCAIPAAYYDKMLNEAPDLLATNINRWFEKYPAKRMVRTLDGTARAFLSDRYRALENEDLATAIFPVLYQTEGLDIMSCQITDKRLYVKVVRSDVTRALESAGGKFGDGKHTIIRMLSPATTISNSEVGGGALSIITALYDGFCSNLAAFGERSKRTRHTGGALVGDEESYALLTNETKMLKDAATWSESRDLVKAAFDEVRFGELCDKIDATKQDEFKASDAGIVVLRTAKKLGLNEPERKSILDLIMDGGNINRFGMFDAVTRLSQTIEDYDRATDLEAMGGKIIELAKHDWRELVKAPTAKEEKELETLAKAA